MSQGLNSPLSLEEAQKAVDALLKPPALEYSRSLLTEMDANPGYLESHGEEIVLMVERFLSAAGIYWDLIIIRKNLKLLVREIIVTLRRAER